MWSSHFGIKRFFYVQQLSFAALGIDVTSAHRTFTHPMWTAFLCFCMILTIISWSYRSITFGNDVDAFAVASMTIFGGLEDILKIFFFICMHKPIKKLIQRIWLITENATKEELAIISAENRTDKKFSSIYFIGAIMQTFIVTIMPHIITLIVYMQTGQIRLFLPSEYYTPFDQKQPVYYPILILWNFFTIFSFIYGTTSIDMLYSWLVHNIAAQFRTLKIQIHFAAQEEMPSKYLAGIRRFIVQHQRAIVLANELDIIFRPLILYEFLLMGFQLCVSAFQLSRGVPLANLPFVLLFTLGIIFQLTIYSYGGQKIEDESQNVGLYISELFPWHSTSENSRKLLLISLLRAQKCCRLSGIFFSANWLLFVWVVTKAYSLFTLLLTLVDKKY